MAYYIDSLNNNLKAVTKPADIKHIKTALDDIESRANKII